MNRRPFLAGITAAVGGLVLDLAEIDYDKDRHGETTKP